jgi:membrane protease YdiL (CAAX protease family)
MRRNQLFRVVWRDVSSLAVVRVTVVALGRYRRRERGRLAPAAGSGVAEVAVGQDTRTSVSDSPTPEPGRAVSRPETPAADADRTRPAASTGDLETPGPGQRRAAVGRRNAVGPLAGAAVCICVEAVLIAPGHVLAGEIVDALLVFVFLQFNPNSIGGASRSWRAKAAICALALVPFIRVIALGLPLRDGSEPAGLLAVASLVGVAAFGLAPAVGITRRTLVGGRIPSSQLPAVFAGVVAYLVGAPVLWPAGAAGSRVLLALLAAVCAAAVEEIVFRGVVQVTLQRAAGRAGVVAATAVFASTYLGAKSAALILVFALAGLVFAQAVARTGTLGAPIAGHVLLVLGAGAVWPLLLGRAHPSWVSQPVATIALAVAVAAMTVILIRRRLPHPPRPPDPEVPSEAEAG